MEILKEAVAKFECNTKLWLIINIISGLNIRRHFDSVS